MARTPNNRANRSRSFGTCKMISLRSWIEGATFSPVAKVSVMICLMLVYLLAFSLCSMSHKADSAVGGSPMAGQLLFFCVPCEAAPPACPSWRLGCFPKNESAFVSLERRELAWEDSTRATLGRDVVNALSLIRKIDVQTYRFPKTIVVVFMVLSLTFVCQGQPTDRPEAAFTGQITDLDLDQMTMTVQALPLIKIFAIAPDCEVITKTKPQASLEDLRVGDEVEVTYQDVGGTLIAHRILQRNGNERFSSRFLPAGFRYLFFRRALLSALASPSAHSVF